MVISQLSLVSQSSMTYQYVSTFHEKLISLIIFWIRSIDFSIINEYISFYYFCLKKYSVFCHYLPPLSYCKILRYCFLIEISSTFLCLTLLRCHKNTSVTGVVGSFQTPNDSVTSLQEIRNLYDNSYQIHHKGHET